MKEDTIYPLQHEKTISEACARLGITVENLLQFFEVEFASGEYGKIKQVRSTGHIKKGKIEKADIVICYSPTSDMFKALEQLDSKYNRLRRIEWWNKEIKKCKNEVIKKGVDRKLIEFLNEAYECYNALEISTLENGPEIIENTQDPCTVPLKTLWAVYDEIKHNSEDLSYLITDCKSFLIGLEDYLTKSHGYNFPLSIRHLPKNGYIKLDPKTEKKLCGSGGNIRYFQKPGQIGLLLRIFAPAVFKGDQLHYWAQIQVTE